VRPDAALHEFFAFRLSKVTVFDLNQFRHYDGMIGFNFYNCTSRISERAGTRDNPLTEMCLW